MGKLALAAGLADIPGVDRCRLRHSLLIGYLRLADVGLDLELPEKSVHYYLQMQLAHTGNNGLTRLLIRIGLESRVLLSQL